jgi:hypothetical protein
MRHVFANLIPALAKDLLDILHDPGNEDDYMCLKIEENIHDGNTHLHYIFALGVAANFALIKAEIPLLPFSPALIKVAIHGIDSILDDRFIQTMYEQQWDLISQVPADGFIAISNMLSLKSFIVGHLNMSVCY